MPQITVEMRCRIDPRFPSVCREKFYVCEDGETVAVFSDCESAEEYADSYATEVGGIVVEE
jgi:hypothetical protein